MDYDHFGHDHVLTPLILNEGEKISCRGCERLIFEPFHGCLSCEYYLHDRCMIPGPQSLDHVAHPTHPLTLLPTPTYTSGSYSCKACRQPGSAFSYSCASCEFDLHLPCAFLPQTIMLDSPHQHPHELKVMSKSPCKDGEDVLCNICNVAISNNCWLYYCAECKIGVHLDCACPDEKRCIVNTSRKDEQFSSLGQVEQSINEMLNFQADVMNMQNKMNTLVLGAQLSASIPWRF